jgi:hypothetical protein
MLLGLTDLVWHPLGILLAINDGITILSKED